MDGDGDVDVFEGNDGVNRLWLGDGKGRFSVSTTGFPPVSMETNCVLFADVDGDRDPDLVIGTSGRNKWPSRDRLYLNDGKGAFKEAPGALPGARTAAVQVAAGDFDSDGDVDLVFADHTPTIPGLRFLANDGRGRFSVANKLPKDGTSALAVTAVDLDGDRDLDLVAADDPWHGDLRTYLNDGKASFGPPASAPRIPLSAGLPAKLAVGDLDGDGDPDVTVGAQLGHQNRLLLGDGRGNFVDDTANGLPKLFDFTHSVALADVDGDGDLDWISGNLGWITKPAQNLLYLNSGKARFVDATSTRMPKDNDSTLRLRLSDLDRDGDPDLLIGNRGQNRLYFNDGKGSFSDGTTGRLPIRFDETNDIAVGDLDGDGDPDFLTANGSVMVGDRVRLHLNDGKGRFVDASSQFPRFLDWTSDVVLADVDRDGDLDAATTSPRWGTKLYLNDGRARFADASARLVGKRHSSFSATFLDIDEDGDMDLFVGAAVLYVNDGHGRFRDVGAERLQRRLQTLGVNDIVVLDADLDGDQDLMLATGSNRVRLLFNRHRQGHTPHELAAGLLFTLRYTVQPGYGKGPALVFPLLSLGPARIRLRPYGVLGLAPGGLLFLPPALTTPDRSSAVVLTVPRGLLAPGAKLYTQGLVAGSANRSTWRLSNSIEDVLR